MFIKVCIILLSTFTVVLLCNCTLSADSKRKNKSSIDNKQLLIISTVDGKVSALDIKQHGKLMWSIDLSSGPLISSSITKLVYDQNGKTVRLIPSLHGGLFKFDGDTVEAVPFDTDQLLQSSFRLADNTVLVGGKESRFTGVDVTSGNLLYTCSVKGCDQQQTAHETSDIFIIKRLQQTVRSIENRNGAENWNFSVSELDMDFSRGSDSLLLTSEKHDQASLTHQQSSNHRSEDFDMFDVSRIKFVVPDGIVCMVTPRNKQLVMWKHSFASAIASAWVLFDGRLHKIDMFDAGKVPALDKDSKATSINSFGVIYMGNYEKQVYIQASPVVQRAVSQAIDSNFQNAVSQVKYNPPRFTHRPYLSSSRYLALSSTDPTEKDNSLAALNGDNVIANQVGKHLLLYNDDRKLDKGYYFQGDLSIYSRIQTGNRKGRHTTIENKIRKKANDSKTFTTLVFSLAVMLLVPYFLYRYVYASYIKDSAVAGSIVRSPSIDVNSFPNLNSYDSRFFQDFEPEKYLGRGGFGVVFKAKNRMDDRSYAVKRILLPSGSEARDKVLREVRVLAQLDHPFIVRYFNSWSEQPPSRWQEEKDRALLDNLSVCSLSQEQTMEKTSQVTDNQRQAFNPRFTTVGFDYEMTDSARRSAPGSLTTTYEASCPLEPDVNSLGRFFRDGSNSSTDTFADQPIPFQNYQQDSISIVFAEETSDRFCGTVRETNTPPHNSLLSCDPFSVVDSHVGSPSPSSVEEAQGEKKVFLYIQMQLCREESLKEWLSSRTRDRPMGECVAIFRQVVDAVKYIHERELIHRDLKPSNVLFSLDGTIKVGDFGLVTSAGESPSSCELPGSAAQHTRHVGTMLYMAPEQMSCCNYTSKVDIFALGLILFELFSPFDTQMEKVKHFADARQLKFGSSFIQQHPRETSLISSMLEKDPLCRPTAYEVGEDQIFKT